MPCSNTSHDEIHIWPSAGRLFICRCETRCGYCSFNELSEAAFENPGYVSLRQHVKASHMKSFMYAKVTLEPGHRGRVADNMCPCEAKALAKEKWAREEEDEDKEGNEDLPPQRESETTTSDGLTRKRRKDEVMSMVERWSSDVMEHYPNKSAKRRRTHAEINAGTNEQGNARAGPTSSKTHQSRAGDSSRSSGETDNQAEDDTEQQEARPARTHGDSRKVRSRATNCGRRSDTPREDIYASVQTPNSFEDSDSVKQSTHHDKQINNLIEDRRNSTEVYDAGLEADGAHRCEGQSIADTTDARDYEGPAGLVMLQGHLDVMVRWAKIYGEQLVVAKLLSDAAEQLRSKPSRSR